MHAITLAPGSFALLGSIVTRDATVAVKLRAAGAVLPGKVNLSEWATFRRRVRYGLHGRGGQVSSPYTLGGDPLDSLNPFNTAYTNEEPVPENSGPTGHPSATTSPSR